MMIFFAFQALLFIILGIPLYLQKIKPNAFYGFRTGKTLSDPQIWYAVNHVLGIDLCIAGCVMLLGAFLLKIILKSYPPLTYNNANLALLLFAVTTLVIHCFMVLKRY